MACSDKKLAWEDEWVCLLPGEIKTIQTLNKKIKVLWRAIPVDELLQADSPLLDEGFLEDALVSSERQQSFQGLPWQRRNYNLEGELRVNVFRYISTRGHKKKKGRSPSA